MKEEDSLAKVRENQRKLEMRMQFHSSARNKKGIQVEENKEGCKVDCLVKEMAIC